jgi:magnesium-transporting ATPase (P-type)
MKTRVLAERLALVISFLWGQCLTVWFGPLTAWQLVLSGVVTVAVVVAVTAAGL